MAKETLEESHGDLPKELALEIGRKQHKILCTQGFLQANNRLNIPHSQKLGLLSRGWSLRLHLQAVNVSDGYDGSSHVPGQPHKGADDHQNGHPEQIQMISSTFLWRETNNLHYSKCLQSRAEAHWTGNISFCNILANRAKHQKYIGSCEQHQEASPSWHNPRLLQECNKDSWSLIPYPKQKAALILDSFSNTSDPLFLKSFNEIKQEIQQSQVSREEVKKQKSHQKKGSSEKQQTNL